MASGTGDGDGSRILDLLLDRGVDGTDVLGGGVHVGNVDGGARGGGGTGLWDHEGGDDLLAIGELGGGQVGAEGETRGGIEERSRRYSQDD